MLVFNLLSFLLLLHSRPQPGQWCYCPDGMGLPSSVTPIYMIPHRFAQRIVLGDSRSCQINVNSQFVMPQHKWVCFLSFPLKIFNFTASPPHGLETIILLQPSKCRDCKHVPAQLIHTSRKPEREYQRKLQLCIFT